MLTKKEREELNKIRERQLAIKSEIGALKDKITTEKRGMTKEEEQTVRDLQAEKDQINLRAIELENPVVVRDAPKPEKTQTRACTEILQAMVGKRGIPDEYAYLRSSENPLSLIIPPSPEFIAEQPQFRDVTVQGLTDVTPVVPITIKDIIEPLEKGLILDQLGLKIQTGIEGVWNYPVVEAVTAEWAGENDAATVKKIDMTKITPSPKRMTLQVNVSNRAIWQSGGAIRDIVLTQINAGLQRKLNETMFLLTNTNANAPDGCFKNALTAAKLSRTVALTYTDINELRAAVEGTGVQRTAPAFVCNTAMYYTLKSKTRDAGSGLMVIDANGTIDGVPVYVTEYAPANFLGYGLFGYELLGQFGPMSLSVDANSAAVAGQNMTAFVLNGDWDMMAFRNEAFGYLTVTAS